MSFFSRSKTNKEPLEITCANYDDTIGGTKKLDLFVEQLFPKNVQNVSALKDNRNINSLKEKYKFMIRFYLLKGLCYDPLRRPNRKITIIQKEENGNTKKYLRFNDRNYIVTIGKKTNNRSSYVDLEKTLVDRIVEMTPFLSFNLLKEIKINFKNSNNQTLHLNAMLEISNANSSSPDIIEKMKILEICTNNIPNMSFFSDSLLGHGFRNAIGVLIFCIIITGIIAGILYATGGMALPFLTLGATPFVRAGLSGKNTYNRTALDKEKKEKLKEMCLTIIDDIFRLYNVLLTINYNRSFILFGNKIIGNEKDKFVRLYLGGVNVFSEKMEIEFLTTQNGQTSQTSQTNQTNKTNQPNQLIDNIVNALMQTFFDEKRQNNRTSNSVENEEFKKYKNDFIKKKDQHELILKDGIKAFLNGVMINGRNRNFVSGVIKKGLGINRFLNDWINAAMNLNEEIKRSQKLTLEDYKEYKKEKNKKKKKDSEITVVETFIKAMRMNVYSTQKEAINNYVIPSLRNKNQNPLYTYEKIKEILTKYREVIKRNLGINLNI
jgi:hypothetical protein